MKTRILTLSGIVMSILFQTATAAEPDSTAIARDSTQPFQLTFITPLGTNGYLSHKSTNYVSMNIIAGYNGGVEGIEIGGFANLIEHDMNGSQLAGFANLVKGDMNGVQMAGFANVVNGQAQGIMLAGFTNNVTHEAKAVELAGFSNQNIGRFEGAQVAGFSNLVSDSAKGLQLAGFGNFAGKESEVTQIGGFMNLTQGEVVGTQVAGFGNIATEVTGTQVAGFVNIAKEVNGFQIGFINLADSFASGHPIGFYSHVNDGYRRGLVQTNELAWIEGQYRTGVDCFHNIFSVAFSPLPGSQGWSFGYGLGSMVYQRPKSDITVDIVTYHINEGELWTEAINHLIRLSGRYTYHPTDKKFGIAAGPSLNLLNTSNQDAYGEAFTSNTAPYSLLEDKGTYFTSKFWIGGQVGITF